MDFEFSPDQQHAVQQVHEWREYLPRQYFTMGGLAGTGKTTLISHFAGVLPATAVCAPTGKAAQVLRDKGVHASTIHGLIYVAYPDALGRPRFARRRHLDGVQTIVADEASMIDYRLFRDILSFGVPVLFVGDHGQLEPIGKNPNLMKWPDVRLEEIHRQALGNPILQLASHFREGKDVRYSIDPSGRLEILPRSAFKGSLSRNSQAICGFNKTRHRVNRWIREKSGYGRFLVHPGERLICLRNNKLWNLFNGQQVIVLEVCGESKKTISLEIETNDGRQLTVECMKEQFGYSLLKNFQSDRLLLFDYGYCITAHKGQGSEWDCVVALEQIWGEWSPNRWRYTVATRAMEQLVYCC
jgi:exodeoxyribonuclease-5